MYYIIIIVTILILLTYNRNKVGGSMGDKGLDFKHKEVVNITNGKRLGYVQDVCADLETGTITHIIVPRKQ